MLYDEPTTGLDPITSTTITDLIVKARDLDRVSSILVTHQLRDAFNVARTRVEGEGDEARLAVLDEGHEPPGTEFLMLREGQVVFEGTAAELRRSRDPYLTEFLS
jgi:phospholipid/cholesterol/gamma-HCH transport system ATP-binding protein